MSNEIQNSWLTPTNIALPLIHDLAAGELWHGDNITDNPIGSRQYKAVEIYFKLIFASAPAASDEFKFYFLRGDEHASEIWTGNVAEAEAVTATTATILAITDNVDPEKTVTITTGAGTTQCGSFIVRDPTVNWIPAVYLTGATALAASGNLMHYRYFEPQGQN